MLYETTPTKMKHKSQISFKSPLPHPETNKLYQRAERGIPKG